LGHHDRYGKSVLKLAMGDEFSEHLGVCLEFCKGSTARLDGVVGTTVAIEIVSCVPKQFRGALLDLLLHPYPKKLMILLPANIGNAVSAKNQCDAILTRFLDPSNFRVVVLKGIGGFPALAKDAALIKKEVTTLLSVAAEKNTIASS
jgi:hypothetical protein